MFFLYIYCKNIKPKLQYLHKHKSINNKKFATETKTSDGKHAIHIIGGFA